MKSKPLEEIIEAIAKEHFLIDTLEIRNSDRLDFHEVGVCSMKKALLAAFEAGEKEGYEQGMDESEWEHKNEAP